MEHSALVTIALISVWQFVGVPMMLIYAALIAIPDEIIDAAQVEGAGPWRIFWAIRLPLILPTLGLVNILTFVGNFNAFDLVYTVKGASAGPNFSTDLLGTLFYRTFFGYQSETGSATMGAALATLMFMLILAGVAVIALGLDTRVLSRLSTAQTFGFEHRIAQLLGMEEEELGTKVGTWLGLGDVDTRDNRQKVALEGFKKALTDQYGSEIANEVKDPVFTYDPALLWNAKPAYTKVDLAPGPNNPVGNLWIGLSKPHWGIHGTPSPSRVGREETNGCLHLTNWDAAKVSMLVAPGFVMEVREK